MAAELALELGAGGGADLLDLRAAGADQDRLLGLGLGPDLGRTSVRPSSRSVDLVDLDLDRVGQLLAGAAQDLLADQLGQLHLAGKVGSLLGREEERALGHQLSQSGDQWLESRRPSWR